MPRYFFHVYDDIIVRDDEGIELPDEEVARRVALEGARALICDQVKAGRVILGHRLEVQDEAGAPVVSLRFGEAIEIES